MATTQLSDVIVPERFGPYTQQLSEVKTRIVESGMAQVNQDLSNFASGAGLTTTYRSCQDLIGPSVPATDDPAGVNDIVFGKIESAGEVAAKMTRSGAWSAASLSGALAGADPMQAIARLVASWRQREFQRAVVETLSGVFADNAAAPVAGEHVQGDLTHDISGTTFEAGVTNFSASAVTNALLKMGDSMDMLTTIFVHSVVYVRMLELGLATEQKQINPIDGTETIVRSYLGRTLILDDGLPTDGSVYETWLAGAGTIQLGIGTPNNAPATETDRKPEAGQGMGEDRLFSRHTLVVHPAGHKWTTTPPSGGPAYGDGPNGLRNAANWQRVFPERKQIKLVRLVTREN